MKKATLDEFREQLISLRARCTTDMSQLTHEALRSNRQDANGDLSRMPIHMADMGSDNYEQEFTLGLIENEQEVVGQIDAALARIDANNFGVCEECEAEIPMERLSALPYASMCIDCARKQEIKS